MVCASTAKTKKSGGSGSRRVWECFRFSICLDFIRRNIRRILRAQFDLVEKKTLASIYKVDIIA